MLDWTTKNILSTFHLKVYFPFFLTSSRNASWNDSSSLSLLWWSWSYLYIWFPNDTSFDVRNAVLTSELFSCLKFYFSSVCQVSFISNLRRQSQVHLRWTNRNLFVPISSEDLTRWRTPQPRRATAWRCWSSPCWSRRTRWWPPGHPGSSWQGWVCTSADPPCPRPAPWPSCCWWQSPESGCPLQSSRWSCLCWSHSGICQAGRTFPHQSLRSVNKTFVDSDTDIPEMSLSMTSL